MRKAAPTVSPARPLGAMNPGPRRFAPTGDQFASESPIDFASER